MTQSRRAGPARRSPAGTGVRADRRWSPTRSCRARSGAPVRRASPVRWIHLGPGSERTPQLHCRGRRRSSACDGDLGRESGNSRDKGQTGTEMLERFSRKSRAEDRIRSQQVEPDVGGGEQIGHSVLVHRRKQCDAVEAPRSTASANEARALPSPATATRADSPAGNDSTASSRRSRPFATPIAPRYRNRHSPSATSRRALVVLRRSGSTSRALTIPGRTWISRAPCVRTNGSSPGWER